MRAGESRPGRRRPYTVIGIRRLPCVRPGCPARAEQTWSCCADGGTKRPCCGPCARAIDGAVLAMLGGPRPRPRRSPYSWAHVRRSPCSRPGCTGRGDAQWDLHGAGDGFRILCRDCDCRINATLLRALGDPEAEAKLARYCRSKGCAVPLKKGYGKKSIAANFRELDASKTKRSRKQKIAIVLSTARKAAAAAGKPSKGPRKKKSSRKRSRKS